MPVCREKGQRIMTIRRTGPRACIAAMLFLVAAGCGDDERGRAAAALSDASGVLGYVPADTPYLVTVAEPLPDDVREALDPAIRETAAAYRNVLQASLGTASPAGAEGDVRRKDLREAALALMSADGMSALGIDRSATLALYGYGLLPVLRVSLANPGRFGEGLEQLAAKAGATLREGAVDGREYRYLETPDGARVVAAEIDGFAVVAALPAGLSDAALSAVLGIERPADSLAGSGAVAALAETYGFTPHGLAFADFTRIAGIFTDDRRGIDAELLELTARNEATALSDVCKAELQSLAAVMPRVVAGYTEVTGTRLRSLSAFELREDISKGLAALPAPVPGLGQDGREGVLSFGLSLNASAAREFYAEQLDGVAAEPWRCERLSGLQEGVSRGRATLEKPLPPFAYAFRGFRVVVEDFAGGDPGSGIPPSDVDMRVLLATENAEGLLAMGALFSPEIAALDLKPDSQPARIAMPDGTSHFGPAFVAMSPDALALAVGEAGDVQLAGMLAAPAAEPPPFLSLSFDAGRYYGFMGRIMTYAGDAGDTAPGVDAATARLMQTLQKHLRRISLDVLFTERGVEVPSTVDLAD